MKTNVIHIGGRIYLNPDKIMILEANVNYTLLYLLDGQKLMVATTLKQLEKRFIFCHNFFRPHKSHIVNLNYLSDYQEDNNKIIMKNAKTILLSRRKKTAFKSKVNL